MANRQPRQQNRIRETFKPKFKKEAKLESNRQALAPLKKRKRDLQRLLEHAENLPADIRVGHERELASVQFDLEEAQTEAKRQQMIKKYHMVRFFERKKATRALKKARQRLAQTATATENDKAKLETDVHNSEVDLNYTLFYPLDQPYLSLYADQKDQKLNGEMEVTRDQPMWKVVEDAMNAGQLQGLRDGKWFSKTQSTSENDLKVTGHDTSNMMRRSSGRWDKTRSQKAPNKSRADDMGESDLEDGGAFFE